MQSLPDMQPLPPPHLVAHEPPHSMSVSVPFLVVSLHTGTAHLLMVQTRLVQSPPPPQPLLGLSGFPGVPYVPARSAVRHVVPGLRR